MPPLRALTAAALLGVTAGCATSSAVDARLEEFRRHGASAELAGIVVAQRDATGRVRTAAAGCAQFDVDGRRCRVAIGARTLLRVASISKLATALAVMRLAERGQLDLDRDVSDYLGYPLRNPAFPARAISLRELLSHTSSLIDGDVYWAPYPLTLRQLLDSGGHFDGEHAPGSCFRYTNLNFGVIGSVLERVSGLRFDALMQREVFGPAGIEAGFNWSGLANVDASRVGTIWKRGAQAGDDRWLPQVDDFGGAAPRPQVRALVAGAGASDALAPLPANYEPGSNGTLFSPQGGMRISIEGLLALGEQLLPAAQVPANPRLLQEASLQRMLDAASPAAPLPDCDQGSPPTVRRLGLGVEVLDFGPGQPQWVGHFGDAYGLKAAILSDRKSGTVRAYIINGSAAPLPPASPPYVEMDTAEAALLRSWPLR